MSRRSANSPQAVSLFPFLAVLLCTMGSLILLMLRISHPGEKSALQSGSGLPKAAMRVAVTAAVAEREQPAAPVPPVAAVPVVAPVLPGSPPAAKPRNFDDAIPSQLPFRQAAPDTELLACEPRDAQLQEELLADAQRRLRAQEASLMQSRRYVAAAREKLQAALAEINLTQQQREALAALQADAETKQKAAETEKQQLLRQIASTSRNLELLKKRQAAAGSEYAIVPYEGQSGTVRHPLYVECTDKGYRILPEDVWIHPDDFEGFTERFNPLLMAMTTLQEYWSRVKSPQGNVEQPYVLLLVRPSGTVTYYLARKMLTPLQVPFGYELIEEDWKLQEAPAAPGAKAALQLALAQTFARRDQRRPLRASSEEELAGGSPPRRRKSGTRTAEDNARNLAELVDMEQLTTARAGRDEEHVRDIVQRSLSAERSGEPSGTDDPNAGGKTAARPVRSPPSEISGGENLASSSRGPTPAAKPGKNSSPRKTGSLPLAGVSRRGEELAPPGSSEGNGSALRETVLGSPPRVRRSAASGRGDNNAFPPEEPLPAQEIAARSLGGNVSRGTPRGLTGPALLSGEESADSQRGGAGGGGSRCRAGSAELDAARPTEDRGMRKFAPGRKVSKTDAEERELPFRAVPGHAKTAASRGGETDTVPGDEAPGEAGGSRPTAARIPHRESDDEQKGEKASDPDPESAEEIRPVTGVEPLKQPPVRSAPVGRSAREKEQAFARLQRASQSAGSGRQQRSSTETFDFGGSDQEETAQGGRPVISWTNLRGRRGIGLQKGVEIHVLADRLLIGPDAAIVRAGAGETRDELVKRVLHGIEIASQEWDEAPHNFYWIPTVNFKVYPGGNQHYERIHPKLRESGIESKVDYALDGAPGRNRTGGRR